MKFHALVASVLGIGYIGKGGGTIAAIAYCIIWFILPAGYETGNWQVLITVIIIILGTWSSNEVDNIWGKDSNKVVIDEIAGMAISLLFIPKNIWYMLITLVAFRFFDIMKPFGIRKAESLPRGWGVMADDILAGVYALTVVHFLILIAHQFS
jgi:phosphatidylglycerophosphatase A